MKEKVAIINSLGAHGSSFHFYIFGQAKGLSKSGVDVSIYTNNVTNNPNYDGVNFYQFYTNISQISPAAGLYNIYCTFNFIIVWCWTIFPLKLFPLRIC